MRRGGLPGKARDPGGRSSPNVRNQNLVRAALHHQQTVIHLWLHYRAVWELHHYFSPAHNGKWNHFNRRCDDYSSQEMFFCSIFCFPSFSAFYNLVVFFVLPSFQLPAPSLYVPYSCPVVTSSHTPMTSNFNLSLSYHRQKCICCKICIYIN